MRLNCVKLQNFRAYTDEVQIKVADLTVILGQNDAGKSSILEALDIFFNEPKGQPEKDDFNVGIGAETAYIICVFSELPDELVIDERTPTNLCDEYMLNADGCLEIKKLYTKGSNKVQAFAVAQHPQAQSYDDLHQLKRNDLRSRARQLGVDLDDVNQNINTELRQAIWQHADDLQVAEVEIELAKESAKAVWDKLRPLLPVYALFKSDRASTDQDSEAQDPMKIAIKEAIQTQQEQLAKIQATVVEQVQEIANRTRDKLMEMSPDLARQLTPRVKTKSWDGLFSVSLTGDEDVPINKRGSGTRRLILLNFFRAKAEQDSGIKGTGVIYAVEEPETSQHPNNQRMLIDAFDELVSDGTCQVLLTTHTPALAKRFNQSRVRVAAPDNGRLNIKNGDDEEALRAITTSLGILPDHDVKVFVGVEGKHDIKFLQVVSKTLALAGHDVPDLELAEQDGRLIFIPCGGSSVELWVARLNGLGVPEYHIFDRDTQPPAQPHYHQTAVGINQQPNAQATHTTKRELENYIHLDAIVAACPSYAGQGEDFEDVPALFAQAVHEEGNPDTPWADLDEIKQKKKEGKAKKRLNSTVAESMTAEQIIEVDANTEVRGWLEDIRQLLEG